MTRLALRIAYDGTHHRGWQTQPDGRALQDIVETALSHIAQAPVATICAGRTDAGVHARAQVVHFDTQTVRPLQAWVRGVNAHLPSTIAVQSAAVVGETFDARRSAMRRRYEYVLHRSPVRSPLLAGRAGWVHQPLDVARMSDAARSLLGRHDFSAFRSSQCQARSPVREIHTLHLSESGSMLVLEVVANAFLHHMVRNLVGALVWVGQGRRPAEWVAELLQQRDRSLGAPTFAPDGLYLTGVDYDVAHGLDAWSAEPLMVLAS
jgi:tRNA pseudouridine38-40 synthase